MFLFINTAQQNKTTIGLKKSSSFIIEKTWPTKYHESEKLLPEIDKLFKKSKNVLTQVKGLVVVNGPGGFSSVRIGVTVANTLAYVLKIPVASVKLTEFESFKELIEIGESRLKLVCRGDRKIKKPQIIKPFYGKEPNITISN